MNLQKQQDFLARLYTDEGLRQNFLSEPAKIGAANDLNEKEIDEITGILPEEINFFADSLFWKRLREVEKFLPLSKKVLAQDFTKNFREFARDFNPQTIKKHLEDALGFGGFLQKQNITEIAKNTVKFERAKLNFFGGGKRLVVCKLDFDVQDISRPAENPAKKIKIAVWLKIGRKFKHFIV